MPRESVYKVCHNEVVVSLQFTNHTTSILAVLDFQNATDFSIHADILGGYRYGYKAYKLL